MAVFAFYMGAFCIGFGILAGLADLLEKFNW